MDDYNSPELTAENLLDGYANQWELMEDMFSLIDYRLYLYYKYHQWLGPGGDLKNMLGLMVSREEFENTLMKSAQAGLIRQIQPDEMEQLELSEAIVKERIAQTDESIRLGELSTRFELDAFEVRCVILSYAATLDSKYEKLFAYLQDDITRRLPSISLAVQLYLPLESTVEEYISFFDRETSFTSLFDKDERAAGNLRLKSSVTEFLSGGNVALPKGMKLFDGTTQVPDDPLVIRHNTAAELDALMDISDESVVQITGPDGSGRRFQIEHLCERWKMKCVFVDMAVQNASAVEDAWLIARMLDAGLCFHGLESTDEEGEIIAPSPTLIEEISRIRIDRLFITAEKPVRMSQATYELTLESASLSERLELFEHYMPILGSEITHGELASKFRFEPRQIMQAARHLEGILRMEGKTEPDSETIHRCCYRQVVHRLDKLAFRIKPSYTWDDVVLPQAQKSIMMQAAAHIRHQHRVYTEWGFDRKVSYGRGLSILFAGAPGTGKTMCAQVLAGQLNMEMYKINISQIVSKYIGETEKNLHSVFREARSSNCILFFDECDALFSKRSDVKDAHDRNANVEVAYLLQQMEEHDGVCILASNLIQNIDAAFMRRITYVVHFPFPDVPTRKAIYMQMIPPGAPVSDDIDWDFIAEKFYLSGGHIKNIVVSAAFMAASDEKPISMRYLLTAAVNELKKNEIVVVKEELREYADLIFDTI